MVVVGYRSECAAKTLQAGRAQSGVGYHQELVLDERRVHVVEGAGVAEELRLKARDGGAERFADSLIAQAHSC